MNYIWKIAVCCLLLTALSTGKTAARQQDRHDIESIRRKGNDRGILVATHRGGLWQKFPENSLESVRAAIDLGVDFIEVDVRKTRDNALILMHDKTLNRCTNGTGTVKDYTLAQIKSLYLRDKDGKLTNYRVPTLQEALLVMKGRVFIKLDKYNEEKITDEIVKVLKETGTTRQASFRVSLDYEKFTKKYGAQQDRLHLFPALESDSVVASQATELQTFRQKVNPVVFQAKFKTPSSAVIAQILPLNRAGYHIWTMSSRPYYCGGFDDKVSLINPEQGWGQLIARGVTIIETDYPEQLMAYLKQQKLHS